MTVKKKQMSTGLTYGQMCRRLPHKDGITGEVRLMETVMANECPNDCSQLRRDYNALLIEHEKLKAEVERLRKLVAGFDLCPDCGEMGAGFGLFGNCCKCGVEL